MLLHSYDLNCNLLTLYNYFHDFICSITFFFLSTFYWKQSQLHSYVHDCNFYHLRYIFLLFIKFDFLVVRFQHNFFHNDGSWQLFGCKMLLLLLWRAMCRTCLYSHLSLVHWFSFSLPVTGGLVGWLLASVLPTMAHNIVLVVYWVAYYLALPWFVAHPHTHIRVTNVRFLFRWYFGLFI